MFKAFPRASQLKPSLATVISVEGNGIVEEDFLRRRVHEYESKDDVFHARFLQGVIFTFRSQDMKSNPISLGALALLKSWGTEWYDSWSGESQNLPDPGVYIASQDLLFEVYKIYDDQQGAFLTSLLPGTQG